MMFPLKRGSSKLGQFKLQNHNSFVKCYCINFAMPYLLLMATSVCSLSLSLSLLVVSQVKCGFSRYWLSTELRASDVY